MFKLHCSSEGTERETGHADLFDSFPEHNEKHHPENNTSAFRTLIAAVIKFVW